VTMHEREQVIRGSAKGIWQWYSYRLTSRIQLPIPQSRCRLGPVELTSRSATIQSPSHSLRRHERDQLSVQRLLWQEKERAR
jgi:hypothetical protein